MRFAAPVRRTLGFRTLFNLLGPLTNPAGTKRQVIGVPNERTAMVFAETFRRLGSTRAMVVAGAGGLDEISPDGFTFVSSIEGGATRHLLLDAGGEYGERFGIDAIKGGDAAANAKILLSVLKGEDRGAYRAAAVENAAAAIIAGAAPGEWRFSGVGDFNGDGTDDLRLRTAAGDLGAQLVLGADTLDWKYYGSVGAEWSTKGFGIL